MRHSRDNASKLLLFLIISTFLSLIEAQISSNTTASLSPSPTPTGGVNNRTPPSTIVGGIFAGVLIVSLMMVSIIYWVRRRTRKAMEAREAAGLEFRKKGRFGTQNTNYALDTSFAVPTGISSFNFDKKSAGAVSQPYLYNLYAKAPLDARSYEPIRQQSISISNGPTVPYQIPLACPSASSSSLPAAFASRPSERPIIRSLHRTTSDIFKPLPEPPAVTTSPGEAISTPPPPPVQSVAFPGSSDPNKDTGGRREFSRSILPHAVVTSSGLDQGRTFGIFGHTHHPYAPYAQDYRPGGQRWGSDASTSSLGITIGGSGAPPRDHDNWSSTGKVVCHTQDPNGESRPRSQSLSSLQCGNSYHQGNSIYKQHSTSQNPSTTSLSCYPDATSADGLARSYSQTVLARPESRASSITSKKFDNQLFSR